MFMMLMAIVRTVTYCNILHFQGECYYSCSEGRGSGSSGVPDGTRVPQVCGCL